MRLLIIAAYGGNDALHTEALAAACQAVEAVNHAPVYRAWIEVPPSPSDTRGLSGATVIRGAS